MLKKLTKKNSKDSNLVPKSFATNPLRERIQSALQKAFTRKVVDLYERQTDIKKFTEMVLNDEISEDFIDNTQAELLMKDVFDPFQDESFKRLAENEKLLNDLTTDVD